MAESFALAQIVKQLREELTAVDEQAGDDPMFTVDKCEIELGVTIETAGKGGVNLWFFELGGDRSKANTSTIRLTLTPIEISAVIADDAESSDESSWRVDD